MQRYQREFIAFSNWCEHTGQISLSADPETIALYLVSLTQTRCGISRLNQAFYSINWIKILSNEQPNACENKWLLNCLEGCRRIAAKPKTRKEPVTVDMIQAMVTKFGHPSANLKDLRIVTLSLIAFAGFLRFNEVIQVRRCDLIFHTTFCSITLPRSKTDVYRQGKSVLIARTGNPACPVTMLERYLTKSKVAPSSDELIFRGVAICSKTKQYVLRPNKNRPLSYSTVRVLFNTCLTEIGFNAKLYGLHSLRAGGATVCANAGIKDRLWKRHGRWSSDKAKDGYIKDDVKELLSVSLQLGL